MGWALITKFWPLLPPAINCLYRYSYQKFLLCGVPCNASFRALRCLQTHRCCEIHLLGVETVAPK